MYSKKIIFLRYKKKILFKNFILKKIKNQHKTNKLKIIYNEKY